MAGQVNHDRAGQNQKVVFPLGDLHPAGVAPGKPLLRKGGPEAELPPEFVFVVGVKPPLASRSSGPGTSTVNRQLKNVNSAQGNSSSNLRVSA